MIFVPSGYESIGLTSLRVWHHPSESANFIGSISSLAVNSLNSLENMLEHTLAHPLHLCVYGTNADATAALHRNVPTTMLMAPHIGPEGSLIVCQSPRADPRNGDLRRMHRHLAHEVAHVMLAELTGGRRSLGVGGNLSHMRPWFDEGFAEVSATEICGRPDIIEEYLMAAADCAWNEDELDAILNDIESTLRPIAFAEAVRKFHALCRGSTLRRVIDEAMRTAASRPRNSECG